MSRIAELLAQAHHDDSLWVNCGERTLSGPRRTLDGGSLVRMRPSEEAPAESTDWLRGMMALRKHWRQSVLFAASVMVTVLLVTVLTKPVYSPVARVEIDPPGAELFSLEGRSGPESAPDYLETQARNMQSDQLLVAVMRQLQLDRLSEFTHQGLVSRSLGAMLSAVEKVPARLWGGHSSDQLVLNRPDLQILSASEATTLRAMQKQLSVERDTASRLVNVSFTTHDPALSAVITNALVRSFIERTYQTRHAAIMESTDWLSRQLDDIRAKMEESNRQLADFQRSSGITDVDQNRSTVSEQMGELSRQRTQAQAERIQIQSYLGKYRRGDIDSLPQVQSSQVVQLLSQRLGETRAELSQTLAVYGKNHPNAKKLQNQVEELESQVRLQKTAIVAQMETSYAAAMAREQMIDSQMRGTSREIGQMAQYTAMKKEAQASSDLYNALYARVKEAGIAAASKSINIRVVDQARVLDAPTSPRPLVNLGIALCIALIGGVLLAFVREALDTKVRTLEDVRRSIGISAVSTVPIVEGNGRFSLFGTLSSVLTGAPKGGWLERPTVFLLDQPASEQSEAFRGIHTSVMLSRPDHPPRLLLVTSSLPGEGKTTVAINLAVMLAQQGRTCILDADLRRPSIGQAFHLSDRPGLGDYLLGLVSLDAILSNVSEMATLTLIGAGKAVADPAKFINSPSMRSLVQVLRERWDFVVIDSPPILPYADGRALAPLADGVIFVGRVGAVTRSAMSRSMELLEQVHSAPILDVVLNGASTESSSYGYRYKYGEQNS